MVEYFAPSVVIPADNIPRDRHHRGAVVTPPGWMWVFAFALRGCEWAIKEADTPKFRKIVTDWMREKDRHNLKANIDRHFEEIKRLKEELRILDDDA